MHIICLTPILHAWTIIAYDMSHLCFLLPLPPHMNELVVELYSFTCYYSARKKYC